MSHPFGWGAFFGVLFGFWFFVLANPLGGLLTANSPIVAFGKLILILMDILATVITIISLFQKKLPRNHAYRGFVGFIIVCALTIQLLTWYWYGFQIPYPFFL